MKRTILILGVLGMIGGSLIAHPKGFKICMHKSPRYSMDSTHVYKTVPVYESGIDIFLVSQDINFPNWCTSLYVNDSTTKVHYSALTPMEGGYNSDRWYSKGGGVVGRYVDWHTSADSLAIWNELSKMYADSMLKYHENDTAFRMYRIMDGDSGSFYSGISTKYAAQGFEKIWTFLSGDDYFNTSDKNLAHYTYFWGSVHRAPYSLETSLSRLPHLDVFGPSAYVFYPDSSTEKCMTKIIESCRHYARSANMQGKAFMHLIQCAREHGDSKNNKPSRRPNREELRAASWISLTYGCAWLGYYDYLTGSTYYNDTNSCYGSVGVIEGWNGSQKAYVADPDEFKQATGCSSAESSWFNTCDNTYMDLYYVIHEIREIGDTLGNLTWLDGFSKMECPRGWVDSIWGADSIDCGMFRHDNDYERYLMVVNRNTDTSDTNNITIKLRLDGSVTYNIVDVAKESILCSRTADTYGYLNTFTVDSIPPGGGVLLHLDPTSGGSGSIDVNYHKATWDVNGRKIAVDKFGRIHVCYTDSANSQLSVWYARSEDACSTWYRTRVDINACWPSIAVDNNGSPYIAYLKRNPNDNNYDSLYLWKEGTSKFQNCPGDAFAEGNHPSIALNSGQGIGIVYYTDNTIGTNRVFKLTTLEPLSYIYPPNFEYGYSRISCCFSDSGDAVGAALTTPDYDTEYALKTRVVTEPSTKYDSRSQLVSGNHGPPSVANQYHEVWAAYCPANDVRKIRYKETSYEDDYEFPADDSFSVIATTPGTYAEYVQIAEGMPFVVWEDHVGNTIKIYYSLQRGYGSWTAPQRVTSTANMIVERYPHVAIDRVNNLARIIWTQWGEGDTCIGTGSKASTDDSVHVVKPNGGEKYQLHDTTFALFWQEEHHKANPPTPESTLVEVNYHYPNGGWVTVAPPKFYQSDESLDPQYWGYHFVDFDPAQITDSARIRVTAFYGDSAISDVSDSNFSIVEGDPWVRIASLIPPGGWPLGVPPSDSIEVYWGAKSYSGLDTVILQHSMDGGESYSYSTGASSYDSLLIDTAITPQGDTLYGYEYYGNVTWIVPTEPTSKGYLRMMAVDTTSDTGYSDPSGPFRIPPPGGFQYNTYSNQNIMSLKDDGDKIGLVYTAQDPDTADKLSVIYMESDEGLDFSAPDTVGLGCWPAFSEGACFWQNVTDTAIYHPDSLFYAYQLNDTFATPYPFMAISPNADSGGFAPVGVVSENDTVHAIIKKKAATHEQGAHGEVAYYSLFTLYTKFPEASPGMTSTMDTIQYSTGTSAAGYNIVGYAPSVVKRDSVVYGAYNDVFNCCFATITPSGKTTTTIGQGLQPSVSCSEGNITYTYLGSGDTSLIRLWRYLDDTTWVEHDTFYLDDDAEVFCGEEGLMYGVQREDTFLADLYVYDPISEEYYLTQEYTGYYPHTYLDDEASEFAWITAFADYVDSSTTYMHTERHDMNVILPALYQEADDKRSPYTLYRDTCIHYTSVDVDSAADSLVYRFPHLNTSEDYAVIVEFYTECDSTTQLQVTVGSTVDTIQIPANSFSWYEQNMAARTDTLNLAIRRISQFGFVPVSRVLVRRRSSEGFFMSAGGPQSVGPVQIPFCLYQPFPNPFADAATIRYSLPYATHVSLKIYDVSGRLVNKLVDGEVAPGVHELRWTGKDDVNRRCASGVYFVRFQAADYQASKKMVLIK